MKNESIGIESFRKLLVLFAAMLLASFTIGTLTTEAKTKSGKCIYCSNPCYGQSCYCKDHDPDYKRTHTKCYVKECNSYTAEGCGSYCAYHYNQKFGKKNASSKATTTTKSATKSTTKATTKSTASVKIPATAKSKTNSSSTATKYKNTSSSKKKSKSDPYDVYDYDDPDDFAEEWAEEFGDGSFDDGYDDAYDYWEDEH